MPSSRYAHPPAHFGHGSEKKLLPTRKCPLLRRTGAICICALWNGGFQVSEDPSSKVPDLNATDAEVRAAIDALSAADTIRIRQFAKKRGQLLKWGVGSPTWEDLIQEAMARALTGSRHWNKDVPFVNFLLGIIRSISSHSARQISKRQEVREADLITEDHEGVERNPLALAETAEPDPHEELTARELLDRIDALFDEDPEALLVIAGMRERLTGPEIQALIEIDQRKYEAIVKRVSRTLRRELKEDD